MIGLVLLILAQVSYALGGVLIKKYLSEYNPLLVISLMAFISGLVFFTGSFFRFQKYCFNFYIQKSFTIYHHCHCLVSCS